MTLEKIYNLLNTDFGRADDFPPNYFFENPIQSGPYTGHKLDKQKWDHLLNEYYDEHVWDSATGYIFRQTLEALDLSEFIPLLEKKGKLINGQK